MERIFPLLINSGVWESVVSELSQWGPGRLYNGLYTSLFTTNGRKQVIIIVTIITVKQLN